MVEGLCTHLPPVHINLASLVIWGYVKGEPL